MSALNLMLVMSILLVYLALPCCRDRRCGYAGSCVTTELLFWMDRVSTGFMLNDLLIITKPWSVLRVLSCLVMCKAMNRSIWNVVFGGFGATPASTSTQEVEGEIMISEDDLRMN